jgi:hypothetical protein
MPAAMTMTPSIPILERFTFLVSVLARFQEASEVPEICELPSLFSVVEEKDLERSSDGMEPESSSLMIYSID